MINNPVDGVAILIHHLMNPEGSGQKLKERSAEIVSQLSELDAKQKSVSDIVARVNDVTDREGKVGEREAAASAAEENHRQIVVGLVDDLIAAVEEKGRSIATREANVEQRENELAAAEARLAPLRELAKKLA